MTAMDAGDFDLGDRMPRPRQPEPPEPPGSAEDDRRRRITWIAAAAAAVVAAGVGLWWLAGGGAEDAADAPVAEIPGDAPDPLPPPEPPPQPPEPPPDPVELPALGDSDGFVRDLVNALLAHPNLAAWLVGDNLIRQFVVTVDNVANGRNPAQQLAALRPERRFRTTGAGEQTLIDPASFQRYDLLAGVIGALDPRAAALLLVTLEPLLDEAHRELGNPDTPFRRNLERAIRHLLAAPVIESPPVVIRHATLYLYADESLEALTVAQKQFLGMGPDNVRVVQAQLRALASELGLLIE